LEIVISQKINLSIMEVLGRVKLINPVQQVSASFKKRELVVTTEEQYPQHILIEFAQDKTDLLNNYNVGEQVKVSINLRGREWVNPQGETKYFNSIQGWRIEKAQAEAPSAPKMPPMPAAEAFEPATNFKEEEHDDLPF
jgi:translation initiation factor IF-3